MVAKNFQIYSVKITANTFVSQKIESVHFHLCLQAKLSLGFLSLSSRQTGIAHFSRTAFLKIFFPERKRGGGGGRENYGVEKNTKINKGTITSFDKFHHLCNLYIFGLCFVVQ